jgi:hypothetical protein
MEQMPKGTRFEATEDIDTDGLVHWYAPLTSGFHCVIPKGTILVTFRDCSASSAAVPRSAGSCDSATFTRESAAQVLSNAVLVDLNSVAVLAGQMDENFSGVGQMFGLALTEGQTEN